MTLDEILDRYTAALNARRAEWPWTGEPKIIGELRRIDGSLSVLVANVVLEAAIDGVPFFARDAVEVEHLGDEYPNSPEGMADTALYAMQRAAKRKREVVS